jgi:ubiquinone/menaquinone biosynthesis C-methylase UbiE
MPHVQTASSDYALGDSLLERQRLREQAHRLRTLTQRFLSDAGIEQGMRILELGSGTGEVTSLLAELVGKHGRIVGLERSPVMLAQARARIADTKLENAEFIECSLDTPPPLESDQQFDAVVGRLILTHLADPAATLRLAVRFLRSGGLVAFQEADFTLCDHLRLISHDRLPLVTQICEWIDEATSQSTMNRYMGLDLYRTFRLAGLPSPTIHFHTEVYGGLSAERVRATITIMRSLLPKLEQLGVSAEMVDIETLGARLAAETRDADVVQARASIASAWAIKP